MPLLRAAMLVAALCLPAPALASPASELFAEVSGLLEHSYGGLSTADRDALVAQAQTNLAAACAPTPDSCPASAAYDALVPAVAALGDHHSYLNTPTQEAQFQALSGGNSRLQFGFSSSALPDGSRVVIDVMPDSPAQAAGMQRGDHLVTLNGKPYDHAALGALRAAGGLARLGIVRGGRALTLGVQASTSSGHNLPQLHMQGSVAVIRIPTFSSGGGIAQTVQTLIAQAKAAHAGGVVVDLRDNPGGNMYECDLAATSFAGRIDRVLDGADGRHSMTADGGSWSIDGVNAAHVEDPQTWDGPLAVLVNARSASCSEFFALAVQRSGRGVVIGEATAGVSNTSTSSYPLPDGGALHLTRSHFTDLAGAPYPERVLPDQLAADDLEQFACGNDVLLKLGLTRVGGHQLAATPAAQH